MQGPGWGVPEDVLRLLPGPGFEVVQAADEAGLPVERPAPPRPPPTGAALGRGACSAIRLAFTQKVHPRPETVWSGEAGSAWSVPSNKLLQGVTA